VLSWKTEVRWPCGYRRSLTYCGRNVCKSARRMYDDGNIWEPSNEDTSNKLFFTKSQVKCKLDSLEAKQRWKTLVSIQNANKELVLRNSERCLQCYLTKFCCICKAVSDRMYQNPIDIRTLPVKVIVFMHNKERYRASNTGKLIEMCLPSSEVCVYGVEADEFRLLNTLKDSHDCGKTVIILFPGKVSVPLNDSLPQTKQRLDSDMEHVVVLIDGTWDQAKRMIKFFPVEIPRVALDPEAVSQFALRVQSKPGRISTVEAAALMLEQIGSSFLSEENQAACLVGSQLLSDALRILVDSMLNQGRRRGRREFYLNRNALLHST